MWSCHNAIIHWQTISAHHTALSELCQHGIAKLSLLGLTRLSVGDLDYMSQYQVSILAHPLDDQQELWLLSIWAAREQGQCSMESYFHGMPVNIHRFLHPPNGLS